MIIQDLITRAPVTVARTDSVREAARKMSESDVGSVLVLDDEDVVVGILTDRDIVVRLVGQDLPARLAVDEIMTLMPLCLHAGIDVERALKYMQENGVRRVPVLDEREELLGVVSLDDILIHLGRTMGTAAALIRAEVAGIA